MSNWTPVRKGKIYCSPACGAECTYSDFVKMTNQAKKMCEQLGENWTPKVTENLGWHCRVVNANATIHYDVFPDHPKIKPVYSAWISIELGRKSFQFINEDNDIYKALAKSKKEAKQLINIIKTELEVLEI